MIAQGQNRLKYKGAIDLLILAVIAIIALAIPFTARLVQQRQEVRKEAAGTLIYCGNGACGADENCTNCPADCGQCPVTNCSDPSGQSGDSYCRENDLLTCVSRFGVYFWDGRTCPNGCSNNACQDAPGCTNPSSSAGNKTCISGNVYECIREGAYTWELNETCLYGCSNGSCNTAALTCDGKASGTTECTGGQDSYNECNNGSWENHGCSAGEWCPAGGSSCVARTAGLLACGDSPHGTTQCTGGQDSYNECNNGSWENHGCSAGEWCPAGGSSCVARTAGLLACGDSPHGTTQCTGGQDSYNECNNGSWENHGCSAGEWCPAGGSSCVARTAGLLACGDSPHGTTQCTGGQDSYNECNNGSWENHGCSAGEWCPAGGSSCVARTAGLLACGDSPHGTTQCTGGQDSYNECNNGSWENHGCSAGEWCPAGGSSCVSLSATLTPTPNPDPIRACESSDCGCGFGYQCSGIVHLNTGASNCSCVDLITIANPVNPYPTYNNLPTISASGVINPHDPCEKDQNSSECSEYLKDNEAALQAFLITGGLVVGIGAAPAIGSAATAAYIYGTTALASAPAWVPTIITAGGIGLEAAGMIYTVDQCAQDRESPECQNAIMYAVTGMQAYQQAQIARNMAAMPNSQEIKLMPQLYGGAYGDELIAGKDIHQTMFLEHVVAEPSRIDPNNQYIRNLQNAYNDALRYRPSDVSRVEVAAQVVYDNVPYRMEAYDQRTLDRARTLTDKILKRGPEMGAIMEEAGGGVCLHQSQCVAYLASGRNKAVSVVAARVPGDRHAFNAFEIQGDMYAVDVAQGVTSRVDYQTYLQSKSITPQYVEGWMGGQMVNRQFIRY